MNISHMESFAVLAKTLNFTKASKQLYVTQPKLSKTIMHVEQEIGAKLFIRNKRDVSLTAAGEIFYKEIEGILRAYRSTVNQVKIANKGISGKLDVGFLGTAMVKILPSIVNQFRAEYPEIELNLYDYTYSVLQDALLENKLDIAILPDRELSESHHLEKRYLVADDMCVTVNRSNALAALDEIELANLNNEPFVIMDPKISIRDYNMVTAMCFEQDFIPKIVYKANTTNNLLMMVDCNLGISVLANHMSHFAGENVKFIRIIGYENYFRLVCAWLSEKNPCVENFLNVIEKCKTTLFGKPEFGQT
jgi:DNA-binding transcriptional LysR family regulator